jgi:hypothetical protein
LTATSAYEEYARWWFVAVGVRCLGGLRAAEGVDGVLLEAESDVDVDGGGDTDVGMAEEFLDHDEEQLP